MTEQQLQDQDLLQKTDDRLKEILDGAMEFHLDLSEDEAIYDIVYISKKLAQLSTFQEKLRGLTMELTHLAIRVHRRYFAEKSLFELIERKYKYSPEYRNLPRDEKKGWLFEQIAEQEATTESWRVLKMVLEEVRIAVTNQIGTMNRLNSDLRLHAKLYDIKVALGAVPRPTFEGKEDGIDIT